ncbi:MAG: class I SAM-dependent methyltransferase [Candidatus Brocadia sp.]|jgi:2-polyprenyl-3-methyl-5-hydroxy-6-metoxy-1,4-benzoquinol methylase|uniref:Methyltransferase domain-containing protein n=1 Tax=Candidatus Brocadia fulgida TaxID=380242 RepID=A0A0M2UWY9_9BACT|nr:MAG: hypothetical protein BROFUL_00888 [Candidatus Brocadia fulgida]UJS20890.1 MAG: class I SAM-dependent methyltransferase [Candidatus Brocadia sp.]
MVFKEKYANAYDDLYQDKDYEKECDFIEAIFKKFDYKPTTILDLGCGTGGHALILSKRGYKVTGIDRSEYMLEIAKSKAHAADIAIEYVEGDITSINLNRKFDAVVSMFAVMSYQTTNAAIAAVCKLAKDCLVPGGLFMFDCWHGPAVLTDKPTPRIKEVNSGKGEKVIRFTEPQLDIISHIVKVTFKVWNVKNNELSEANETHPMRFLFPQEIKYFLEVAGFDNINFYPFLNLDRDLTVNDWNMMVVGKQKQT